MKHNAHFTPPAKQRSYLDIDIMDGFADAYICTLRYPKPPLYPICPINMDALTQFIYERRPTLKTKDVIVFIGEISIYLSTRKQI